MILINLLPAAPEIDRRSGGLEVACDLGEHRSLPKGSARSSRIPTPRDPGKITHDSPLTPRP